jgi:ssDNA-binding Zn-finger/Zn-ribbon topoisomerase 1
MLGEKCPKCGSKLDVTDTDMWSHEYCTNTDCDYDLFEDWED